MAVVLHLLPADQWQALAADEPVLNASLEAEGFIHCTDAPVVLLQVANAFYTHVLGDFVALHVDTTKLTSDCVWEAPAHIVGADPNASPPFATTFPHIYGPIDRTAIVGVDRVARDRLGRFIAFESTA
jgi:uncharacterized protein (DUF952 family)